MRDFYLVQRGTFTQNTSEDAPLTGCNGIVSFDDMRVMDFRKDAIPKSFRRILWDYKLYDVYSTGVRDIKARELKIFARRDRAYDTIIAIRELVNFGWACGAGMVKVGENVFEGGNVKNFWWCVDMPTKGNLTDWMAFFAEDEKRFKTALKNDYKDWWMAMKQEVRASEYNRALMTY